MRLGLALKLWHNRLRPYYRICHHHWCFRYQTSDYRCPKHWSDR